MPEAESAVLTLDELTEAWSALSDEERVQGFVLLSPEEAAEFLSHLSARDAQDLIGQLPEDQRKRWLALLPPDDLADIVQEASAAEQKELLGLLDEKSRKETTALLAYDEDDAGGLMTPRFVQLRPDWTVAQATDHLRDQARRSAELIYYAYVVDAQHRLVGVVSFRELVRAAADARIADIMTTDLVTLPAEMDQEEVSRVFAHEDLYCLPVVDAAGRMKGIITADDIVDVVHEEATEDMHKLGGTEALEAPYLQVHPWEMLRKRVGWLIALLLMGFFTVEAMSRFQVNLADLVVLNFFVPLIISCGGNSGSQAATLVVRAMALGQVRLRDWWRVIRREFVMGLLLGTSLGTAGAVASLAWHTLWYFLTGVPRMGTQPAHVALAVACSILCVVLWGTLIGSMLPFGLRRLGADPASASAPLVATMCDATGLVLYFTVASTVLLLLGT